MIEETFKVKGAPKLDVRIQSGRIEIREGTKGTVSVMADTRDPDFYVKQNGNTIVVASEKNQSWLTRGSSYVQIETPSGTDADIRSAAARVDSSVDLGKVHVKTASGNIEISNAESLTVKSASGDASVRKVSQELTFTSASGDLFVHGETAGATQVSTASGDVHIERSTGNLEINTVSGDAHVLYHDGRTVRLKSMSGNFDVGIPVGTDLDIDVNLLSGRLHVPESKIKSRKTERSISMSMKSVSGDLTINRAD